MRSDQKTILFHLSLVRTQELPISTECLRTDQDEKTEPPTVVRRHRKRTMRESIHLH
jgi:hypothetical protein